MDINEVPKGGKVGKAIDVVIDTANVIVETTKEIPARERLNILFPFLAASLFLAILIFFVKSMIEKNDANEKKLNDKQDIFYEERRADLINRLWKADSNNRIKDSTILILTNEKAESNEKIRNIIETQDLMKKLLRKGK